MFWFKKKKYPVFWNDYLRKFKTPQPKTVENTRFVVFDTETTGFDTLKDRILSIGAVSIFNKIINVSDSIEVYLKQEKAR